MSSPIQSVLQHHTLLMCHQDATFELNQIWGYQDTRFVVQHFQCSRALALGPTRPFFASMIKKIQMKTKKEIQFKKKHYHHTHTHTAKP